MFFWRQVVSQIPDEGLKPTATPGSTRNFRDLNNLMSRGKSFSGYERNLLFLNQTGNGFAEVGGLLGVDFDDDARAVATMDWDRDGDLDLWVTNRTAPRLRLLKNNQPSTGSFLAIRLVGNGTTTNRDAIGARLTLGKPSVRSKQLRTVHAGDGLLAQSSVWSHFGLGNNSDPNNSDDLQLLVSWPGGETETFSGLKPGTHYVITQGDQNPRVYRTRPLAVPPALAQPATPTTAKPERNGFWVVNRVPLPVLNFTDPRGVSRSTQEYLGKPLLVNLWATWCVPCMEELRMLAQRADAIRAQGATVLALNVDSLAIDAQTLPAVNVAEVLTQLGYELPHGVASPENLAKIEVMIEYLSSRRAPLSIPSSFLVDAQGNVAAVYLEPVGWEQLSGDLALLTSPPSEQLERASARPGKWFANPRLAGNRSFFLGDYATLYGTNGFPEESQRIYELIQPEQGKGDARAYYNRAKAAAQQGLKIEAMEHYRTAIQLDPKFGPALTGLGAMLLGEKQLDEAERLFEQALVIDPNHATALVNLAMIDQSRGLPEQAIARLRSVIGRNPGFAQAQLNLGSLLASMKRYEEAIQHLSKAIELDPNMVPAHVNLAIAFTEMAEWEKAEVHYRRLLELSPHMAPFAHFGLGNVKARQQRHADAVTSYRTAISLGANNSQTFTRLGISLRALGKTHDASEAFKRALQLDPEQADAKRSLQEIGTE